MEQRKTTVLEFKNQNLKKVCAIAEVSRSCLYNKSTASKESSKKGRPIPGYTLNRDGCIIQDSFITQTLKEYRSSIEFVNGGGVKKLSCYLAIEKRMYINHKKIYRLCNENNLLLFKRGQTNKRIFKKRICSNTQITEPNQLWQFDLKYIWIHGENRWCFFLGFIDVYTRKITGWYIGRTCKAGDLVFTLNQAIKNERISADKPLTIRSDNGPQMSSNRFYFYLKNLEHKLKHEFIPPRTPDKNAYIESFNSILEREVIEVQYFENFESVYKSIMRFIEFYNDRRLHGSLGNLSPKMFINRLNMGDFTQQVVAV